MPWPQIHAKLASSLESPHSVQAFLYALLCSQLFIAPEPMCAGIYIAKQLGGYKVFAVSCKCIVPSFRM
jgi:hypothetical protein